MRNEKFHDGDYLSLPVPAGRKTGDPVKVGSLVGVLATNRADSASGEVGGGNVDGNASVWLRGVFNLSVTGAIANVGDPVYIDGANALNVTNTHTLFGYALSTKAAAAGVIPVRLARV